MDTCLLLLLIRCKLQRFRCSFLLQPFLDVLSDYSKSERCHLADLLVVPFGTMLGAHTYGLRRRAAWNDARMLGHTKTTNRGLMIFPRIFRTTPCVDMQFSRAGRTRGNLPKTKNKKFGIFFWTFGSTSNATARPRPARATPIFDKFLHRCRYS